MPLRGLPEHRGGGAPGCAFSGAGLTRPFSFTFATDPAGALQAATGAGATLNGGVQYLASGTKLVDLMRLNVMRPEVDRHHAHRITAVARHRHRCKGLAHRCAGRHAGGEAGDGPGRAAPYQRHRQELGHRQAVQSRSRMKCYDAASAAFGWNRRNPQPGSMRGSDWLIDWGCATAT